MATLSVLEEIDDERVDKHVELGRVGFRPGGQSLDLATIALEVRLDVGGSEPHSLADFDGANLTVTDEPVHHPPTDPEVASKAVDREKGGAARRYSLWVIPGAHVRECGFAGTALPKAGQARALDLYTRLFVFADDGTPDRPGPDEMALAEELLGLAQAEFARREKGPPASGPHEVEAWVIFQEVAAHAITRGHYGNGRFAKEAQIRVAGGRPLTACTGTLTHDHVQLLGAVSATWGLYGCGAIFEDTTRTSGRPWSTTCSTCRGKRSERRRAAVRARRRVAMPPESGESAR
jgi:hypothetical protein